ncbi:hypothetical protein AB0E10_38390 [Streptomyces sp. NPDC048045]|uniref:hypothetical protein n=1 Tax=Streptomyces sp. NPDC048045 TaxID=3154710 RepID=UPI0034465997
MITSLPFRRAAVTWASGASAGYRNTLQLVRVIAGLHVLAVLNAHSLHAALQ